MSKITLDPDLKAKLNGLNEHLEICDESGATVGHYVPREMFGKMLVAWSKVMLPDEELEKLRQERGGRTLKEIWKDLGCHELDGYLHADRRRQTD